MGRPAIFAVPKIFRVGFFFYLLPAILAIAYIKISYSHPDEWMSLFDVGISLLAKPYTKCMDVYYHWRNLSHPFLVASLYSLSHAVFPESSFIHIFLLRLVFFMAHGASLWGALALFRHEGYKQPESPWLYLGILLFTVPGMIWALQTNIEHISSIYMWVLVGLAAAKTLSPLRVFFIGVVAVMTGVSRYPSGIFGLFFVLAFIYEQKLHRSGKSLLALAFGIMAGLFLGGGIDAVFYGRPYESLWMYFVYNVTSGAAQQSYGTHTIAVYFDYIYRNFREENFLLLGPTLLFSVYYLYCDRKNFRAWKIAAWAYLGFHLLPAHKEGRFLSPLIGFYLYMAIQGVDLFLSKKGLSYQKLWQQRWLKGLVSILILANIIGIFRLLNRDFHRPARLGLKAMSIDDPKVCGVVLDRSFSVLFYPESYILGPRTLFAATWDDKLGELRFRLLKKSTSCEPGQILLVAPGSQATQELYGSCYLYHRPNEALPEFSPAFLRRPDLLACDPKVVLTRLSDEPRDLGLAQGLPLLTRLAPWRISPQELEDFIVKYMDQRAFNYL